MVTVQQATNKRLKLKKAQKRLSNSEKRLKLKLHTERKGNVLRWVKIYFDMIPDKSARGEFLLPAGDYLMEVINDNFYKIYITHGQTSYDSIDKVRECNWQRVMRADFKYLNKPVTYCKSANIVLNNMTLTKYSGDEMRIMQNNVKRGKVYSNGNIYNAQNQKHIGKALFAAQ